MCDTDIMEVSRFRRDDMSDALASALVRLLHDRGPDSITVTDVTREAGVNRTSFYRRFGSVEDVVSYIYRSVMEEFRESVRPPTDGWGSVESYIRTMFETFDSEREVLLALHSRGLTPMMLPVLRNYFPADPDDVASLYRREYHLGGIMGWFGLWFDRGMADSHGEVADETLRRMGVTLHPMMDVRRTRPGS